MGKAIISIADRPWLMIVPMKVEFAAIRDVGTRPLDWPAEFCRRTRNRASEAYTKPSGD